MYFKISRITIRVINPIIKSKFIVPHPLCLGVGNNRHYSLMYEILLYNIYIFAAICKMYNILKGILYIITIRHIQTQRRRSVRSFLCRS